MIYQVTVVIKWCTEAINYAPIANYLLLCVIVSIQNFLLWLSEKLM